MGHPDIESLEGISIVNYSKKVRIEIDMLLDKAIASFGESTINSTEEVARLVWADAKTLMEGEIDNLGIEYLKSRVRGKLKASASTATILQPDIPGLGVLLPTHIAVPRIASHVETEDDLNGMIRSDRVSWVVTWRATIGQLEENVAMRDRLIKGSVTERNRIQELIDSARRAGGKDDDVVIDVMRAAHVE